MERLHQVANHLNPNRLANKKPETLSVVDNRTGISCYFFILIQIGKSYELTLKQGSLPGGELGKILDETQQPLRLYDPGYMNVINCVSFVLQKNSTFQTSRICYIDGDAGILEYRGYPIEQLAEKSTFLEVAFLIVYGELPTKADFKIWQRK